MFCDNIPRCHFGIGVSSQIRQNPTSRTHLFATQSFGTAPEDWFNQTPKTFQNANYAVPPLNKVWDRVDGTYISITVTATRLMQVVPLDWVHYLQMLLPESRCIIYSRKQKKAALGNYHVAMRRKCKTIKGKAALLPSTVLICI